MNSMLLGNQVVDNPVKSMIDQPSYYELGGQEEMEIDNVDIFNQQNYQQPEGFYSKPTSLSGGQVAIPTTESFQSRMNVPQRNTPEMGSVYDQYTNSPAAQNKASKSVSLSNFIK